MNGRQAAKAAAKRIQELEFVVAGQIQDIKDYNACIADMISGESPCLWCEEYPECQLDAKMGKGCPEWWLRYRKGPDGGKWPVNDSEVENEGESVFPECSDSGERAEADTGEDPAL